MQKNQIIELEIHDLNSDGFGVSRAENQVVFVEGALPGDCLRVRIVKLKNRYAYGKIEELIFPSTNRIQPQCPAGYSCGGCQFQHYAYSAQLSFKAKKLREALKRIADCDIGSINCVGMKEPYFYRNKAIIPVGKSKNGDPTLGFYAPRSHTIIPTTECIIQHPKCTTVIEAVQRQLKSECVTVYDEETHQGLLRQLLIRVSFSTGELLAALVINGEELPNSRKWSEALTAAGASTVLININTDKTNTALGKNFKILTGSGFLHEEIGAICYRISAGAFFQVNPVQTKVLYDTVLEFAQPNARDTIVDAHMGIGGIGLYLAGHVKQVLGIEVAQQSVEDAEHNAQLNGITNTNFICGKAEEVLPGLFPKLLALPSPENFAPDILILDPPRKGCEQALLDTAIIAKIKKIIYVSCNPSTLARDIKLLREGGYELKAVRAIDMFPMTTHVECVALLVNENNN